MKKKTILICGAAGLIGKSISEVLINNKYKVVLVDKDKKKLLKLKKKFNLDKNQILSLDLTLQKNILKLINFCKKFHDNVDTAINCSYPKSSNWGKSFIDVKEKYLFEDLNKQLGSTILFATEFSKFFEKKNNGNLILVSSIQGVRPPKFEHYNNLKMVSPIEYSAIKSGIISIIQYLAKYFKKKNLRFNCISPGGIEDSQPTLFKKRYKASCLNKGLLDPKDITGTILFLIDDHSKYINGQNIIIDDGWSL
jgi:NAD(P)-dependent dehydrogenase (short-subunit alcohol dehydrogenase family)